MFIIFFLGETNPQPPNVWVQKGAPKKNLQKEIYLRNPSHEAKRPTKSSINSDAEDWINLGCKRFFGPWLSRLQFLLGIRRLASLGTLTYIIGVMNTRIFFVCHSHTSSGSFRYWDCIKWWLARWFYCNMPCNKLIISNICSIQSLFLMPFSIVRIAVDFSQTRLSVGCFVPPF